MKTSLITQILPSAEGRIVRVLARLEGIPPADESRVPLNLSLVIDRSGSMQGEKLPAVKEAVRHLVRRLHPADRVSLVAFASDVQVIAAPSTGEGHSDLLRALDELQCTGSTNLSGGWLKGRSLVHDHFDPAGVNRMILLTDGEANEGIVDPPTLMELCGSAARSGISTTTVGVGSGFNEELLASMADAGVGSSYYIERPDQAVGVFDEEILGLLSISAQNLSIRIVPRDGARAVIHHDYAIRVDESGASVVNLGDLYAREPRELLTDFVLSAQATDPAPGCPVAIADFVIEGDVWTPEGSVEHRRIVLPLIADPDGATIANPEIEKVFTLLEAAKVRRRAMESGDEQDMKGAALHLRMWLEEARGRAESDPDVAAEVEQVRRLAEHLESQESLSPADRKFLYHQAQMYGRGRRSAGDRNRRD